MSIPPTEATRSRGMDDQKDVKTATTPSPTESVADYDSKQAKAAYRKVDKRILLWYSFVYLILRIHVSNITNAAIINIEDGDGIKKQLGNLNSEQWAWVLSIFYYPYMLAEPTSTMLLKYFSPSIWMSRIMVTWGTAFASSFHYSNLAYCEQASSQCVRAQRRTSLASWLLASFSD